jgi:hypothetical protein
MTGMIQTPAGDYIHPLDYVHRRRWAGSRTSRPLHDASVPQRLTPPTR